MENAAKNLELITKYFADFTPRQLEQFEALEELYREWNSKINVISRKDIDSLFEKHVLHSLSLAAAFKWNPGTEVIDIGTGGGFPGIPLAIYFPEIHFHLVDSIGKKIKVVKAIAENLELRNVSSEQTRAEDVKNRKFDTAVSRAVAPLKDLLYWSRPLLKNQPKGNINFKNNQHKTTGKVDLFASGLICLKGGDLSQEINESGTKPIIIEIAEIFKEEYFREKFILFVG
jgi:16S rRNA (guanine527-N7)-methyltransferase